MRGNYKVIDEATSGKTPEIATLPTFARNDGKTGPRRQYCFAMTFFAMLINLILVLL
ncbi:hypothetical protein RFEPED_0784 [Rickettsia felis str. Pedreira]|uniref:Uncharacterized protein n=1 Tax=Rickettsia felis str. Pedreira TaxID=1359196 RepID=A0A0F3MRI6_RICFI|nr:hypothetical protein [Rickettsia felis]KJV58403.1 hypothetical protein RFEPED_0784 [Rickettsia felis str. Pedreira]